MEKNPFKEETNFKQSRHVWRYLKGFGIEQTLTNTFFSVQVSNVCNAFEDKYLLVCAMKDAGMKDLSHLKEPTIH